MTFFEYQICKSIFKQKDVDGIFGLSLVFLLIIEWTRKASIEKTGLGVEKGDFKKSVDVMKPSDVAWDHHGRSVLLSTYTDCKELLASILFNGARSSNSNRIQTPFP